MIANVLFVFQITHVWAFLDQNSSWMLNFLFFTKCQILHSTILGTSGCQLSIWQLFRFGTNPTDKNTSKNFLFVAGSMYKCVVFAVETDRGLVSLTKWLKAAMCGLTEAQVMYGGCVKNGFRWTVPSSILKSHIRHLGLSMFFFSVTWTNWNTDQPDNLDIPVLGDQDCTWMVSSGKWDDRICSSGSSTTYYICEKGTTAFFHILFHLSIHWQPKVKRERNVPKQMQWMCVQGRIANDTLRALAMRKANGPVLVSQDFPGLDFMVTVDVSYIVDPKFHFYVVDQ